MQIEGVFVVVNTKLRQQVRFYSIYHQMPLIQLTSGEGNMAEFYIDKSPKETGDHLIHFSTCESLPKKDGLKYLGSIASYDAAFKEAKKTFTEINACKECAAQYATA